MTNATTFSLFFHIRKKDSKPDHSTIQARLKVDNDRVDFSLNRYVRTEIWNSINRKAKGSSTEAKQLNLFLDEIRMNIFSSYDQLRREKKIITVQAVKARYFMEDISELTLLTAFVYRYRY